MSKRIKPDAVNEYGDSSVLKAVAIVCRHDSRVSCLPNIIAMVDSFVNCIATKWTLESASSRGDARLLDLLGKREWRDLSDLFRLKRFDHAIDELLGYRDTTLLEVLQWWMTTYLPDQLDSNAENIFRYTIRENRMDIVQWLHVQGKLSVANTSTMEDLACKSPEIAKWLHEHAGGFSLKLELGTCTKESFPFLLWAIEHQNELKVDDVEYAVDQLTSNGMPDEFKSLHDRGLASFSVKVLANAILNDHVDVADWLYKTYPTNRLCDPVRGCNTFMALNWVVQKYRWKEAMAKFAFFEHATINAACNDDFEMLEVGIQQSR